MSQELFDPQDAMDLQKIERIEKACADHTHRAESFGVNPLGVYCAHTGRQVGQLNQNAVWLMAQVLDLDSMTDSQIAHVVLESSMLAMRPSPAWAFQRTERMRKLIRRDNVGACVFYLSRAYHQNNKHMLKKDSGNNVMAHCWESEYNHADWNYERVRLNQLLWQSLGPKELHLLAETLLEADARVGINKIPTPTQFIEELLTKKAVLKLIAYYQDAIASAEKKRIQHRPDGNTQSRLVWQHYDRINKPVSQKAEREAKKAAEYAKMDAVFRDIMGFETVDDVVESRKAGNVATEHTKQVFESLTKQAPKPQMSALKKPISFAALKPKVTQDGD